jgi:hypothetical protein
MAARRIQLIGCRGSSQGEQRFSVRVHTYVIAIDAGSAPNYDPPIVTLAVCKPRIRSKAQIGELVLAFAGKTVNPNEPHTVVWAGVVSEKMGFAEYWNDRRFATKKPDKSDHPDNFYRPVGDGLLWVENNVHGPDATNHDTGGQFVLGFSPSWRFGAHGPLMPSEFGLRMVGGRRGQRVAELAESEWNRLRAWLDQNSAEETPRPKVSRRCRPNRKPVRTQASSRPRSKC